MAQLLIDESILRFKDNEIRFDKFVNDSEGYNTDTGTFVESVPSFLERIESEIDVFTSEAEAVVDAALIQAGVYETEADGRAAVTDGTAFKVQGSGDVAAYEYRRINSTTSTLIATYPSSSVIENFKVRVPQRVSVGDVTPLVAFGGDLIAWHTEGDGIDFIPSQSLIQKVSLSSLSATIGTPIVISGGDVLIGADDNGRVDFIPSPSLLTRIEEGIAEPLVVSAPPITNGENLWRTRAKISAIRIGTVGARLNILLNGDSWTMLSPLRAAIEDVLANGSVVDEGYISASPSQSKLTGFSQSYSSGWTFIDGTAEELEYGSTPDGQCAYSSLTTDTLTISSLSCTRFSIYCREHSGTWRYRVDGGSWTIVSDSSSGNLRRLQITGLSDSLHTIEIDTYGNTGKVVLAGFYAIRDSVGGVQISRMGDGGSTAQRWLDYLSATSVILAHEPPDLIITCLSTNDARSSTSTPDVYLQYMVDLIASARSSLSDTDMLHIVGPQNNLSVIRPTTDYRDKLWEARTNLRSEYLSLSEYFGNWAQANSLNLWADDVHPSNTGARMIADIINNQLIRI